jgi:hypothetical protein
LFVVVIVYHVNLQLLYTLQNLGKFPYDD